MQLLPRILLGFALSLLIGYAGYRQSALTLSGWLGAVISGTSIFGFGGLDWGLLLIAFFTSSTLLTHYKKNAKDEVIENFSKGGPRDLAQTLANGSIASTIAISSAFAISTQSESTLLFAAFAGTMATANADTWATELGILSKGKPRLITNGRVVAPGTSGGITWFGSSAALAGAALVGALAALLQSDWQLLPIAAIAGFSGAMFDSLLGATVQGIYYSDKRCKETEKPIERDGTLNRRMRGWLWMTNDLVNLFATIVGALTAYTLAT